LRVKSFWKSRNRNHLWEEGQEKTNIAIRGRGKARGGQKMKEVEGRAAAADRQRREMLKGKRGGE